MSLATPPSAESLCESSRLVTVNLDTSPPTAIPYAAALARTISEDSPDPRIQVELERLNSSTDTINKLEVELDEARMVFRQLLADSTQRIDLLSKKLGKCVQQARPYYDARIKAKQAMQEMQCACVQYERSVSEHNAAREMVFLAEEGLMQSGAAFDHTWQEMLNHASAKVNAAEKSKHECGLAHQQSLLRYEETEARVQQLQVQLKRAIARSRPYFEAKSQVNQQLEWQKQRVRQLEREVSDAKDTYASALAMLENISEQIHKRRASAQVLGVRGVGVGAESPSPCSRERSLLLSRGVTNKHDAAALHAPVTSTDAHDTRETSTSSSSAINLTAATTEDGGSVSTSSMAFQKNICQEKTVCGLEAVGKSFPADELGSTETSSDLRFGEEERCDQTVEPQVALASLSELRNQQQLQNHPQHQPEQQLPQPEQSQPAQPQQQAQQLCTHVCSSLGGELSGWQLVGAPPLDASGVALSLVDDAVISDSESLASIEMLSDDAIAGLMLEEDLPDASNLAVSSSTPFLTPLQEANIGGESCETADAADSSAADPDSSAAAADKPDASPAVTSSTVAGAAPMSAPDPSANTSRCTEGEHVAAVVVSSRPSCTSHDLKESAPYSSEALLSKIDTMITAAENLQIRPERSNVSSETKVMESAVTIVSQDSKHDRNCTAKDAMSLGCRLNPTSCGTSPSSSSGMHSRSPSKSPTRPSSLPLATRNHPAGRSAAACFVPVKSRAEARGRAETVILPPAEDGSSEGSSNSNSCEGSGSSENSSRRDPRQEAGLSRSASKDSAGTWSPELSTPGYAPLQDAVESPFSQPPPSYPPPPPPRNLASQAAD
ncbi:flocculation protein FLO11-like isoform X2 [Hyalella azteca]|uniref:Flocculation protein FLO11-like isoform X2 n=1 Tax=Hyalella azteca TaxID=294128 RepID=A0A979FLA1_HYAAZ|nr:flocculation protein FLO11-like isoform X2 [Hyalella azteca]